MKHWELEHSGELIRIEWNEAATFNLQTPIGGQWVDYHCFTCYGIKPIRRRLNTPLRWFKPPRIGQPPTTNDQHHHTDDQARHSAGLFF